MLLFDERSRRHAVLNLIQDCFGISFTPTHIIRF
jgi:hypothetical protein